MKEIISKLLESEKKAKEIAAEAKKEADRIASQAETQIKSIREESLRKANDQAKELIARARTQSEKKKSDILDRTQQDTQTAIEAKKTLIPEIINEIIKRVVEE